MFVILHPTMAIRRAFSKAYQTFKQAKQDAFNKNNLFYTNVLFSMSMSMAGDLIEQNYELYTKEIDKIDLERTGQMGLSGISAGIISHHWYNFLDKVIVGRSFRMVIKKLLLDQFISSPIIILSFFATVAIFEEKPLESFNEEVRGKFWKLYMAEWVVWPPAQIINFYFLPTKYRVIFDNTVSLGYDVYNSQVKHHKVPKKTEET